MNAFLKTPLSLLVCGATILAASATASAAETCQAVRTYSIPQYSSSARTSGDYDDVMAWCQNWVSELQQARWTANLEARSGNLQGASLTLYRTLMDKQSQIGVVNPAPNTADAIRVGIGIAQESFAASEDPTIPARLRGELRYLMMDSIYGFIEWTFDNLDNQFYRTVYDTCHGNRYCYGNTNSGASYFPPEYYDAVRQLAVKVLDFQLALAPYQASDLLEMRISRIVAGGAKEILLSSVLRRSLACPINQLDFAEKQISRFLSCNGSALPRREQILVVRQLLGQARNALLDYACANNNSYPHNNPYGPR